MVLLLLLGLAAVALGNSAEKRAAEYIVSPRLLRDAMRELDAVHDGAPGCFFPVAASCLFFFFFFVPCLS